MRKWLGFGIAGAAVAGLWAYASTRPVPVPVGAVERGGIRSVVEEEGKTRVKDRFVISAPVSGFALRIDLKVGGPVHPGQAINARQPLCQIVP